MDQVLARCFEVIKTQPDHDAVIGGSPEDAFKTFLEKFDQEFFDFFKTLKKNTGEEKYGVGILIWQVLHRDEPLSKKGGTEFTYNAAFFSRYLEKNRTSQTALDAAEEALLGYSNYYPRYICEMQVGHPQHGRHGKPGFTKDTPRDVFMKGIFLCLGIKDPAAGRDRWFYALQRWEILSGRNDKDTFQASSSHTVRLTDQTSGTGDVTTPNGTVAATFVTTGGAEYTMDG